MKNAKIWQNLPVDLNFTYTQYGPITNGGITARPNAAVRYRTILRVVHVKSTRKFGQIFAAFFETSIV